MEAGGGKSLRNESSMRFRFRRMGDGLLQTHRSPIKSKPLRPKRIGWMEAMLGRCVWAIVCSVGTSQGNSFVYFLTVREQLCCQCCRSWACRSCHPRILAGRRPANAKRRNAPALRRPQHKKRRDGPEIAASAPALRSRIHTPDTRRNLA